VNVSTARGGAVDHIKIFVDGTQLCDTAPCIHDVSPGVHEIKVLGDGFDAPAPQAVAVGSGKAAAASFTVFPSVKATAEVSPVVAADDKVAAAAAAPAPAPSPAPAPPATPEPKPTTALPAAAPPPVAVAATKPAPAAAAIGEGFININSIPPATCFLDGKSLGMTPRVHVSVPAGTHVVKFVNTEQGLSKTLSVKVGVGETKPAVTRLE
jgi:hypothetical protein